MARVWVLVVLAVVLALFTVRASAGQCSMTQLCHTPQLDSSCHAIAMSQPSFPGKFTGAPACPQYADDGCCNNFQNEYLSFNFILIGAAFGAGNEGCDACVENLKKFWCDFTCSPNQAEFLHPLGLMNVTDPASPDKVTTTVLNMVLDVNPKFACDFYASCKDTSEARTVQTLKTCDGFLDYQGQYEAVGRGNYIQFNYTDEPHAFAFPPAECHNYTDASGEWQSCKCGSCSASCVESRKATGLSALNERAAINPLHGADWLAIGILYAAVAVLSLAIVSFRLLRNPAKFNELDDKLLPTMPPQQRQGFADVLPAAQHASKQ